MAYLEQIIISEETRGSGAEHDPIRKIMRFFRANGELLGETDSLAPEYSKGFGIWTMKAWMRIIRSGLDFKSSQEIIDLFPLEEDEVGEGV